MWFQTKQDTNAVDVFKGYSEIACDSFNSCRYSITKMAAETDANSSANFISDYLGDEGGDYQTWLQLHEERKILISDIMTFADETMNKMETVKKRLKNKKEFKTFQDCYNGFSIDDAGNKAKVLQNKSLHLRTQIIHFYEKIQTERRTTIEQEKFKRVLAGVLLVTGACCGVACLAANPSALAIDSLVVRMGVASLMDRALETSTTVIEKSLAALPANKVNGRRHTETFTQSETKRAVSFLQAMEENPIDDTIYKSMQSVYCSTTELTASTRSQCERLINDIIKESEKLSHACRSFQASDRNINDDNDDAVVDGEKIKKTVGLLFGAAQAFKGKGKVKQQQ